MGSLFLVKNIFSILLSIITILFGFVYPLTPPQITLISAFTIRGSEQMILKLTPPKQPEKAEKSKKNNSIYAKSTPELYTASGCFFSS